MSLISKAKQATLQLPHQIQTCYINLINCNNNNNIDDEKSKQFAL